MRAICGLERILSRRIRPPKLLTHALECPVVSQRQPDAFEAPARSRVGWLIRAAGLVIALVAVALCVKALVDQWAEVRTAIGNARVGWILVGVACAGASMAGLGLLWWRCLHVFGARPQRRKALAWYFGGELGKYVPGGIWPVLGRGELALRAGVRRTTGYLTTLISYGSMTVGAAMACGILAPFIAADGNGLGWGWLLLAFVPLGAAVVHPAVMDRLFRLAHKVTRGRAELQAQPWLTMLELIIWSIPSWLLVGATSAAVTEALGYDQNPARVAFAAIAAWIIGFLAVPVPAGAGLRELVFLALSGLEHGPAVAVATIARLLFVAVDGGGGVLGLWYARRHGDANHEANKEQETVR